MEFRCCTISAEEAVLVSCNRLLCIVVSSTLPSLIFQYFRPGGVQNFRYIVLKKKDRKEEESSGYAELLENLFFLAFSAGIVMWCVKKQHINFTGRHKKYEQDYV